MRKYALGYHIGKWKAECDRCGFDYRNTELRKEWTGLYVCKDCYEERHPQDFLQGRPDDQSVPWTRPDTVVEITDDITLTIRSDDLDQTPPSIEVNASVAGNVVWDFHTNGDADPGKGNGDIATGFFAVVSGINASTIELGAYSGQTGFLWFYLSTGSQISYPVRSQQITVP